MLFDCFQINKKIKDRTGKRYGRLVALKVVRTNPVYWLCKFDCGKYTKVRSSNLQTGQVQSCGCLNDEVITKHNMARTRIYKVFNSMKQRCNNPNDKGYYLYGARGIKICDEWNNIENGFINFYNWAITNGYDENAKFQECTIDRIDVNGNYEPNNCRWINNKEQALNKTTNRYLTYNGKTQTVLEWSKELEIDYKKIQSHTLKGETIEEMLKKIEEMEKYKQQHKVILINKDTKEIFKEFDSAFEACRFLKLTRNQCGGPYLCLQGKRNYAYGYIWRYKNDEHST